MSVETELDDLFNALEFANPHTLFVGDDNSLLKVGKAFQKCIEFSPNSRFDQVFNWIAGGSFEKLKNNNKTISIFFINIILFKFAFKSIKLFK